MAAIKEILEGSSSSSSIHDHRYDVFLSFRGRDTRLSFIDHLHNALVNANITTFLDEEEIETGVYLKPELESAIKASRASIVVLSENYASSTWCLNELVLILEQHRTSGHIVIPVFHHVEPTDVRKQQNSFGEAMAKHKQRMEAETNVEEKSQLAHKMKIWRKALSEVADLKGKDTEGRFETELIEEIVKDIHHRLGLHLRSAQPRLIGVNDSIEFITSWLKDGSSRTVDILTIFGMAGIGKTSLAKYIYGLHCHSFAKSSFVHDISRRCDDKFNGILDVQIEMCEEFSRIGHIQVHDVSVYTSKIEDTLARVKVFLVLDDINNLEQLDALLGSKGLHPGSKVIITTKDISLTERCALFSLKVPRKHTKHLLEGLGWFASLELLCIHAFMSNYPKDGYEGVSKELVNYCVGHPLALEVLGRSLRNRDVAYWDDHIKGLKKETNSRIQKALQMSFDSMSSNSDKELFKHISCFFVGKDKHYTETILKECGIYTLQGITNLIDRCLLTIGRRNELKMHQLIQEMGRDIVRQESPDKPWKRSRIWCHEDSFNVLEQNKGSGKPKGLVLDMEVLGKENMCGLVELKTDGLSKMDNLMLLQLNYVQLCGSYKNFPKKLRWLCMRGSLLKSIPIDLQMELMVDLDMSFSRLESFDMSYGNPQHGKRQKLRSLKNLNLNFCKMLRGIGGFFELPSLERLLLANCTSLIEVCESIEHCHELVHIDLRNCKMLRDFPRTMVKLKKVDKLLLDGCNLRDIAIEIGDNKSLEVVERIHANNLQMNLQTSSSTNVLALPRNFESFLVYLPSSLVTLSLIKCKLSDASFPVDLNRLSSLKILNLDDNPILSLPDCVRSLCKLEILSMKGCNILKTVEHPPRTLRRLIFNSENRLQKIEFVREMSPLSLILHMRSLLHSSFEIEGMVKIQPMADVEDKVLRSLGWTNLEFIKKQEVETHHVLRGTQYSQIQMYYEFGIFSTVYRGKEIPNWIGERSKVPSISFTIASSPNNLRGLNICYVMTLGVPQSFVNLPMILISNITKNRTWIHRHYIQQVYLTKKCLTLLSHWMFGKNEMGDGDVVNVKVIIKGDQVGITECGVSFVYDDEDGKSKEEENALGYYKSWNHIIGGDLSAFQTTTGEYILDYMRFRSRDILISTYHPYIAEAARYKAGLSFRAFSQRKLNVVGRAPENTELILHVSPREVQSLEVSSMDVESLEVSPMEVQSLEVSPRREVQILEGSPRDVQSLEVFSREVESSEVSSLEVRRSARRSWLCRLLTCRSLLSSHE